MGDAPAPTELQQLLVVYFNLLPVLRSAPPDAPLFFDMVGKTILSYEELIAKNYQATESYRLAYPVTERGVPNVFQTKFVPFSLKQKLIDIHVMPLPSIDQRIYKSYVALDDDHVFGNQKIY